MSIPIVVEVVYHGVRPVHYQAHLAPTPDLSMPAGAFGTFTGWPRHHCTMVQHWAILAPLQWNKPAVLVEAVTESPGTAGGGWNVALEVAGPGWPPPPTWCYGVTHYGTGEPLWYG